jgi:demethoxyubiquinone hydroxylase (CLK1/Coq7/Cat5 family)
MITNFDLACTVFASPHAGRPYPGAGPEATLSDAEKTQAAALMRVNHVGEFAQALCRPAVTAKMKPCAPNSNRLRARKPITSPGASSASTN